MRIRERKVPKLECKLSKAERASLTIAADYFCANNMQESFDKFAKVVEILCLTAYLKGCAVTRHSAEKE